MLQISQMTKKINWLNIEKSYKMRKNALKMF